MSVEMMTASLDVFHSLLFVILCTFAKAVAYWYDLYAHFLLFGQLYVVFVTPATTQYIPLMLS